MGWGRMEWRCRVLEELRALVKLRLIPAALVSRHVRGVCDSDQTRVPAAPR
jgi:hypothetical protein